MNNEGEYRNQAMRGAYNKGRKAALNGAKRVAPYTDHRTFRGNKATYSRAFITAWYRGYDDQMRTPADQRRELL